MCYFMPREHRGTFTNIIIAHNLTFSKTVTENLTNLNHLF